MVTPARLFFGLFLAAHILVLAPLRADPVSPLRISWEPIPEIEGHGEVIKKVIGGAGVAGITRDGTIALYRDDWRVLPRLLESREEFREMAVNDATVLVTKMDGATYVLDGDGAWRRVEGVTANRYHVEGCGQSFLLSDSTSIWMLDGGKLTQIYERPADVRFILAMCDRQPGLYVIENYTRVRRYAGARTWTPIFETAGSPELIGLAAGERGRTYVSVVTSTAEGSSSLCNIVERSGTTRLPRDGVFNPIPIGGALVCHFNDLRLEVLAGDRWYPIETPTRAEALVGTADHLYYLNANYTVIHRAAIEDLRRAIPH